jgi:hypothetical protein
MHCEASYNSDSHHSLFPGVDSVIALDDINADDKVLIKTRNSEYRFAVIDPISHKGMLSGGALGNEPRVAYLIESRIKGEDGCEFRGLRIGARALFYLSSGLAISRVRTSEISGLTLVKAADRNSLVS